MPRRGIAPRVAPTTNYGIIGTTVYSDIVDGATQLVGLVNQGKRDVADAEFKREGLTEQKLSYKRTYDHQTSEAERNQEYRMKSLDIRGKTADVTLKKLDRDIKVEKLEDEARLRSAELTIESKEEAALVKEIDKANGDIAKQFTVLGTVLQGSATATGGVGSEQFNPEGDYRQLSKIAGGLFGLEDGQITAQVGEKGDRLHFLIDEEVYKNMEGDPSQEIFGDSQENPGTGFSVEELQKYQAGLAGMVNASTYQGRALATRLNDTFRESPYFNSALGDEQLVEARGSQSKAVSAQIKRTAPPEAKVTNAWADEMNLSPMGVQFFNQTANDIYNTVGVSLHSTAHSELYGSSTINGITDVARDISPEVIADSFDQAGVGTFSKNVSEVFSSRGRSLPEMASSYQELIVAGGPNDASDAADEAAGAEAKMKKLVALMLTDPRGPESLPDYGSDTLSELATGLTKFTLNNGENGEAHLTDAQIAFMYRASPKLAATYFSQFSEAELSPTQRYSRETFNKRYPEAANSESKVEARVRRGLAASKVNNTKTEVKSTPRPMPLGL